MVEKQTDPDGSAQSFAFDASYDADGFSLSDGQSNDSGDLARDYSVSETVPAGWGSTARVCSDGSPANAIARYAAGETVTCVFTNTLGAEIVVEKQTDPDGDPQSFSFSASYDADGFSLSDGQSERSGLAAGHVLGLRDRAGGLGSRVGDLRRRQRSRGDRPRGGRDGDVHVHEREGGAIVVQKQTNPDGDPQCSFTASYDARLLAVRRAVERLGRPRPGHLLGLRDGPAGWDLIRDCSDGSAPGLDRLSAGETVTCVFTNEKDANIVVAEADEPGRRPAVVPASTRATTRTASRWRTGSRTTRATSTRARTRSPRRAAGLGARRRRVLRRLSDPSSIGLQAGETVTCVFTNKKDAADRRREADEPNGDAQSFHFDASYDEAASRSATGSRTTRATSIRAPTRSPRTCPRAGSSTSACAPTSPTRRRSTLAAGETVTCVFTNTQLGTIVVEKQTSPTARGELLVHRRRRGRRSATTARSWSRPRAGDVHLDRGGGRGLEPDLDRLRRRDSTGSLASDGDVQARGGRGREVHLHEREAEPAGRRSTSRRARTRRR